MRVLFAALHHAYFRNFDSVVRELAERGHHVHLTADEPEALGGRELAERLAAEYPSVTWDLLPNLETVPWFPTARKLRLGLDYVRALEPPCRESPKLRMRAEERTPRLVRWLARVPGVGPSVARVVLSALERAMPRATEFEAYLERVRPDVVVLTSLTYSRSQQMELLKAARARRVPVAAAIMSWDHLSSKALLHVAPDMVVVWNAVQRTEAVEMHRVPSARVAITGAQCYDQWFTRGPAQSRDVFCRRMGLDPDRPFALWVHSALSPTPQPPEPVLVQRWIAALRESPDPRLRGLGVLVRPHPERVRDWAGFAPEAFENVAFHGGNPIDTDARDDYFDSLYHSAAVVGLVTSAFLEAAIVGRPVLTMTLPEYRSHQDEMLHFRYLNTVEGGLLWSAPDLEGHLAQLADAVALEGRRDARNERFVRAFIRPDGLDAPATPVFADALERLQQEGPSSDRVLPDSVVMQPLAAALVAAGRTRAGRWLLNEPRDDERDTQRRWEEAALKARIASKNDRKEAKTRKRQQRMRRDAMVERGKKVKSAWRRYRHRVTVRMRRRLGLDPATREGRDRGQRKD